MAVTSGDLLCEIRRSSGIPFVSGGGKEQLMKRIMTLFVLGLFCVAMVGCQGHVFDRNKEVTEKKTVVKYDNGDRMVKTTTVEKN